MVVGIYGKSGTYKTYLASMFRKDYFYVINLDYIARIVLEKFKSKLVNDLKFLASNNKTINYQKLKFTIYNDLYNTIRFNLVFSKYLTNYLKPILNNKTNNWIIEGATLNFLDFDFNNLLLLYKKNNIKKKYIMKNDFKNLLFIQKYNMQYNINHNNKDNTSEIKTNFFIIIKNNIYKNILKILNF